MVRCAVGPDGAVVPDLAGILPGRGLWLAARRDIVELARKKRAFARAARRPITVPDDLAQRIEGLLAARCRDTIGLARRAGRAVAGFDKVAEVLRAGRGGVLLAAADGAADGRRKLAALARDLPVLEALSAAELGAAFGRDHVVHAVLGPGALARRLAVDMVRLGGFRGKDATQGSLDNAVPDRGTANGV